MEPTHTTTTPHAAPTPGCSQFPVPCSPPAAPIPATRPYAQVSLVDPHTHKIRLRDEDARGNPRFPREYFGAEVWVKTAPGCAGPRALIDDDAAHPAPTPSQTPLPDAPAPGFAYLATQSDQWARVHFPQGDADHETIYMLRWINSRGQPGPWTEVGVKRRAA